MTFHVEPVDVLVVGGGHAGVEAAAIAGRMGARTRLVDLTPGTIGTMSCNPAIGGLGKGHLVREIDALDGIIARAADRAAIHYRMLNRSHGPAVWGPRLQADRRRFRAAVQALLAATPDVEVTRGEVARLIVENGRVAGVGLADGVRLTAHAVVLATGTFLGGRMFRGREVREGGRAGAPAARSLAAQLRELALCSGRMKTGTPPRIDARTIDWSALARQPSDADYWTMSAGEDRRLPQLSCGITRTTPATHRIIADAADQSPLFDGAITGRGPRYCPSIEDKVRRFADRDHHQIFLEPEGLDDHLVYPNGLSTSLPTCIQRQVLRSVPGLERAELVQAGYAVEYDHVDPRMLDHRLALAALPGLFLAGQINGTTGYEEAAAQGIVAGANAALEAAGRSGETFARDRSYIGVLIDDLVTQGVTEPYRMLTARAEHRLHLRSDNAVTRLEDVARRLDCRSPFATARAATRTCMMNAARHQLDRCVTAASLRTAGLDPAAGAARSLLQWSASLPLTAPAVKALDSGLEPVADDVIDELLADARYEPYVARQRALFASTASAASLTLPADIDYGALPGLSSEMAERLSAARPRSIDAASRVRGVTPAALTALLVAGARRG